jgi:group I intron endonuclease
MSYIYKITNKINNKSYIGRTEQKPEIRWWQHKNHSNRVNMSLYYAMKKYGKNNFIFEIIEHCENGGEREMFWIDFFDTFKNGYNSTIGGDGGIAKYKEKDLLKLKELYETIDNTKELEKITGLKRTTIYQNLKYHGIQAKRPKGWYKERNNNFKKTYCKELDITTQSRKEMAKKLVELGYYKSISGANKILTKSIKNPNMQYGKNKLSFKDIE